jgi:UDPglucose 6-dehydrogenase
MKIGIVGNGFVGNAIYQNFKDKLECKVYDIRIHRCYNSLEDTVNADIVFVCLPTPMKENGECDLSYVLQFFKDVKITNGKTLFVIKSTVPIGTTDMLSNVKRQDLNVVHNPEFLTAVNAVEDFKNADRHIIGGRQNLCMILRDFYKQFFPDTPIQIVTSKESETIKYFANSFLAAKISFFNNLYEICEKFEMNFDSVKQGICTDDRIGFAHTKVPGPDGLMGFGGYCFPKDINALINTLKENNIDASLFEAAWEYNQKIRKENV